MPRRVVKIAFNGCQSAGAGYNCLVSGLARRRRMNGTTTISETLRALRHAAPGAYARFGATAGLWSRSAFLFIGAWRRG